MTHAQFEVLSNQAVAACAVVGAAMSASLYAPAFAALTQWGGVQRVRALTTLTLVGGLASTAFAPLTAWLESAGSWRSAYLVLAGPLCALEPNEWQQRQALPIERPGVIKVPLPPATLDLARPGLEDLRLLDTAGRETPYVLERAASAVPPTVRVPVSFQATLADNATQLLIATGSTTRIAVCHGVAPAPSAAERSEAGTLERASSLTV